MKTRLTPFLTALAAVALVLFGAGQAFASTRAGETVSNLATLTYEVNGQAQPELQSDDGVPTTFVVDLLVRPHVTRQTDSTVSVTPGQNERLHTFRVNNLGNNLDATTAQYFRLFIDTPTDDLGVTSVTADIAFEDGTASLTNVDIAAGVVVQISSEDFITVTLKANVPNTAVDGDTTVYDLVAMAVDSSNLPLVAADAPTAGVDIVFADEQGTYTGEVANPDGMHSARGTFAASSASFTIAKSSTVPDGFYIPGAVVTYNIEITNNGSAAAQNVVVTDPIPAFTTYDTFPEASCNGDRAWHEDTNSDGNGDTWQPAEPATKANVKAIRCTIASIAADGGDETVSFTVTID